MKSLFVIIFISISVLNVLGVTSGGVQKSKLFHTQTAWNPDEQILEIADYSSYFRKSEIIRDPRKGLHAVLFTDFTNSLSFDYSLTSRIQIGLQQILMQSHNQNADGIYNIPDDLILSMKYQASHPNRNLYLGFGLASRLPIGKRHNILFEPYTSDRISFTMQGFASYAKDPFIPEEGLNIHLNLGYRFHADNGSTISNQDQVQLSTNSSTQEILFSTAFIFPIRPINFTFELHGNSFISSPPKTAYVRSHYFYFTPAFNFPVHSGITLAFGVDLKLMSDVLVDYPMPDADNFEIKRIQVPSLPAWKINAGITFSFADIFSSDKSRTELNSVQLDSSRIRTETDSTNQITSEKSPDQILTPQEIKAEAAKKQLEKMRQERIQRDLQLEELRKKVEQKKQKTQTEPEK